MIKEISLVCPDNTAGLPIAYGMSEALRTHQVYWAEKDSEAGPLRFRQFVEPGKGEKVLLVDDILRTGRRLTELRKLLESKGADVVGMAVAVYQPNPDVADSRIRMWPTLGVFRSSISPRWTPCIIRTPTPANCAGKACRWKRFGRSPAAPHRRLFLNPSGQRLANVWLEFRRSG